MELTEQQLNLLKGQKDICEKKGDKYIVKIYKEKNISILKKLKLYELILALLEQIERVCLRFSAGDFSTILYNED